jgi:hypothetical protein
LILSSSPATIEPGCAGFLLHLFSERLIDRRPGPYLLPPTRLQERMMRFITTGAHCERARHTRFTLPLLGGRRLALFTSCQRRDPSKARRM